MGPVPSPSGPSEEYQYIGSVKVTTNAGGKGAFTFAAPTTVPAGESIAATATLLNPGGGLVETSEFSAGILVQEPPLQVTTVTTTNVLKGRTNEGVGTISIVFNEAMASGAASKNFYSLLATEQVRVKNKTTTEMVPVSFTASASGKYTINLKLAQPSLLPLTLIVKSGDAAADGQTLGENLTFTLP